MSFLSRLFSREPDPREAVRPLWHSLVGIARDPEWYTSCGVADTLEGRFDVLSTVVALAMLRLERDPATLPASARLTELFVEDMDGQLREAGIGDPTVGKKIGRLVSALGGRTGALREGLAADDDARLVASLDRNVTFTDDGNPSAMAAKVRKLVKQMDGLADDALFAGEIGA